MTRARKIEKKITFIDHYDSFSFNVIAWLSAFFCDYQIKRVYFDQLDFKALPIIDHPLVLSPGPNSPLEAESTCALVRQALGKVPILGICLGHQILGHVAGYEVKRSLKPCHGSTKWLCHAGSEPIFGGLPHQFEVGCYHSLAIEKSANVAPAWRTITTCQDGEIQGIANTEVIIAPAIGLQFHPESFLTEYSERLAQNWLTIANSWYLHYSRPI